VVGAATLPAEYAVASVVVTITMPALVSAAPVAASATQPMGCPAALVAGAIDQWQDFMTGLLEVCLKMNNRGGASSPGRVAASL